MPEEDKKQKKGLYFHFVVFVLGSLMLYCNKFFSKQILIGLFDNYNLVVPFLFYIYKNFHNRSFYEQNWEREQIDR
jgi:hypothetical protein